MAAQKRRKEMVAANFDGAKGDWPFGRLARKSDRDLETPQLNSE
jgi:hypothetical protein